MHATLRDGPARVPRVGTVLRVACTLLLPPSCTRRILGGTMHGSHPRLPTKATTNGLIRVWQSGYPHLIRTVLLGRTPFLVYPETVPSLGSLAPKGTGNPPRPLFQVPYPQQKVAGRRSATPTLLIGGHSVCALNAGDVQGIQTSGFPGGAGQDLGPSTWAGRRCLPPRGPAWAPNVSQGTRLTRQLFAWSH